MIENQVFKFVLIETLHVMKLNIAKILIVATLLTLALSISIVFCQVPSKATLAIKPFIGFYLDRYGTYVQFASTLYIFTSNSNVPAFGWYWVEPHGQFLIFHNACLCELPSPEIHDFWVSVRNANCTIYKLWNDATFEAVLDIPSGETAELIINNPYGDLPSLITANDRTVNLASSRAEYESCSECYFYDAKSGLLFIRVLGASPVNLTITWRPIERVVVPQLMDVVVDAPSKVEVGKAFSVVVKAVLMTPATKDIYLDGYLSCNETLISKTFTIYVPAGRVEGEGSVTMSLPKVGLYICKVKVQHIEKIFTIQAIEVVKVKPKIPWLALITLIVILIVLIVLFLILYKKLRIKETIIKIEWSSLRKFVKLFS